MHRSIQAIESCNNFIDSILSTAVQNKWNYKRQILYRFGQNNESCKLVPVFVDCPHCAASLKLNPSRAYMYCLALKIYMMNFNVQEPTYRPMCPFSTFLPPLPKNRSGIPVYMASIQYCAKYQKRRLIIEHVYICIFIECLLCQIFYLFEDEGCI